MKRVWATQKKGQKSTKRVTKRGHYIEDLLKINKPIPAPNAYTINNRPEKKYIKPPILKRLNFIEQIFRNG